MNKKRRLVVTTFYSNGKAVWFSERPFQMDDEEINVQIAKIANMGYGQVDAITDTAGRMIRF